MKLYLRSIISKVLDVDFLVIFWYGYKERRFYYGRDDTT